MDITVKFWRQILEARYKGCISEMVAQEIMKCYETKRQFLLERISEVNFEFFDIDDEVRALARKYIDAGAFTDKHMEDALHVACASVNNCNVVVSWNFKHIVKITAMLIVNGVNRSEGYMELGIVSPEVFMEDDEHE